MAKVPETAAEEIEQTLSLARLEQDRSLSRLRTIIGTALFIVGVVIHFAAHATTVAAFWFLGSYLVVAVAYDVYAHSWRPARYFAWVAHTTDVLAIGLFPALVAFDPATPVPYAESLRWLIYLVPPTMMLSLLIGASRGEPWLAVYSSALATAVLLPVVVHYDGFHQPVVYLGAVLLLAGVAGMRGAQRARNTLTTLVRLQLLRRFLPEAASEQVLADPHAALAIGGQTLNVTVMVTDLRGFTSMSEQMTPEQVVAELNAYHAAMLEQVEAHDGMLDKFMGDGELIVFGLRAAMGKKLGSSDSGAHSAVSCAKAMLRALDELNEERATRNMPALKMGIGIHTGVVVAGNIGAPGRRLEFTVIGDAVNTAARLETASKNVGRPVLVSATTADLLSDKSALTALEPMQLRGMAEPLAVFALG
ncbi:MAG: adenylate/guanylate cyclase domain-containing protein [Myxococcaceae bacterium]